MGKTTREERMERLDDMKFRDGVIACLPTMAGYWSVGLASGALGTLGGFSLAQILMLSGLLYAGSAQFMVYSLHGTGVEAGAIVLAVILVNLRYLLMCSATAPFFRGHSFVEKLIGGALLTDETFAIAMHGGRRWGTLPFHWLLGLNLAAYLNWIAANLVGVALASALPSALAQGLGFSLTAMFVGLLLAGIAASQHKGAEWATAILAFGLGAAGLGGDPNQGVLVATVAAATFGTVVSFLVTCRRERAR